MIALNRAIKAVLLWPYVNKGGDSFETQFRDHLQNHLKYACRSGKEGMEAPVPIIVHQPHGSQEPPDIIIRMMSGELRIECKCGRSESALMWNSGIPDLDTHYLFNSSEGTTIVHGTDLIDQKTIDALMPLKKGGLAKQLLQATLPALSNGWELQHVRPMFQQNVHERKWFSHPDRLARERNSLRIIASYK